MAATSPAVATADPETCDQWHARYLEQCTARGLSTIGDKAYRWRKWISPALGQLAPKDVSRDLVEDLRDKLDDAIRSERLAWRTAANIWGEASVAFSEMTSSKRRDLRVLEVDPTAGVRAPETGSDRAKVYPYPSEFLAVVSCERVPLEWRELHAIAAYTYLRPGELQVLTWDDVDLDDQKIHVTKAWDFKAKKIKTTKTGEQRHPHIEANLLPLLRRMHDQAGGEGLVVPLLSRLNDAEAARLTREHFEIAGCTRSSLYNKNRRRWDLIFRSWRDAGVTWSIVRGDDVVKVQRRAGHKLIATTMRYIVEAENRGASFGSPFPTLPEALVGLPNTPPKQPGIAGLPDGISDPGPGKSDDMPEKGVSAGKSLAFKSLRSHPCSGSTPGSDFLDEARSVPRRCAAGGRLRRQVGRGRRHVDVGWRRRQPGHGWSRGTLAGRRRIGGGGRDQLGGRQGGRHRAGWIDVRGRIRRRRRSGRKRGFRRRCRRRSRMRAALHRRRVARCRRLLRIAGGMRSHRGVLRRYGGRSPLPPLSDLAVTRGWPGLPFP
jgi:integrase